MKRAILALVATMAIGCGDSGYNDGPHVVPGVNGPCRVGEVTYCSHGYQRVIFSPSDEAVYCIPIVGTPVPQGVYNPCGTGYPTESHANGDSVVVWCTGYDMPACQ